MSNLLQETKNYLKHFNLSPKDVEWCGSEDFSSFTWKEFEMLADKEYDGGFGGQEVAKDLVIVGKDWWLERYEYDGSEHWEYKKFPSRPQTKPVTSVFARSSWETLEEINTPEND